MTTCSGMEIEASKQSASYRTYAVVLLFVSTLSLYMLYVQSYAQLSQDRVLTSSWEYPEHAASRYLLWTSKCKLPDVSPFNDDVRLLHRLQPYASCRKSPLLSYVQVSDNKATLHINASIIPLYTKNGISCCYSTVTRATDKTQPDNAIKTSPCTSFETNATLPEDFVIVECQDNTTHKTVYKNVHAAITITDAVRQKLQKGTKKHLSVLCIGIDSVSRLNMMRAMRKTHAFLEENQWLELQCYNKMGDNTFPNLMAIFTGMNESYSYETCNPRKIGSLDNCSLLWYDYRDYGYVTAYAEDEANINTFNYKKKGFVKPPTDYYFRPYMLSAEEHLKTSKVDEMTYCTGPETSGERILNLAKDFAHTFKDHPYFGLFWMNTFSHNKLNAVSRMDAKVLEFLEDMWYGDVLNNTIVLFFSDHGLRFGDIRYTRTGWLEERLPLFYIYVPDWFKETYSEAYKVLEINSKRLTTPFDIYMTLQDLLMMTGSNHSLKPSSACPKCHSLFSEIDLDRSCEDAAIEQHWCTCNGYVQIPTNNATVEAAAKHILNQIHETVNSYGEESKKCAKLKLKKVILSSISEAEAGWYKNDTYLLIILETVPEAVFEATVSVEFGASDVAFEMQGSISRLDSYQSHSNCVHDSILKKYCYCYR